MLDFRPQAGLNVLVGQNAQGKSNLLEAICLLGTGKSFRTNRESDLIKSGLDVASASGEATLRAAGTIRLSCTISSTPRGTRKIYTLNGEPVKYAKFLGSAKVVTFVPADLQLVTGPPSLRRHLLNMALSQDQPLYYRNLARYQKVLVQKAALLRGAVAPDPDLVNIYNQTLVETGAAIMLARAHFVSALGREARRVQDQWISDGGALQVQYDANVPFEVATQDAVTAAFEARLRERAEAESARKACLVGPHRDDVMLLLAGASLAAFGSQGQQRTAVLAVKAGEYTVMHDRSAEAPLLLLDDVLSELDPSRARAFMNGIGHYEQAFLTTTVMPPDLRSSALYEVSAAQLKRVA